MAAPELKRVVAALERIGLDLGDGPFTDPDELAATIEVAARNHAIGRARRRRDMAELRDMQADNARGFAVDADYPVE